MEQIHQCSASLKIDTRERVVCIRFTYHPIGDSFKVVEVLDGREDVSHLVDYLGWISIRRAVRSRIVEMDFDGMARLVTTSLKGKPADVIAPESKWAWIEKKEPVMTISNVPTGRGTHL